KLKEEESTEESTSDSMMEEEENDEEENELDEEEEESVKKRVRVASSSNRRGCNSKKRQTVIQISKNGGNELPVKIMHDMQYDVDYDEMVAWEEKSVKRMRNLRELEKERANGGEIMENLNEFIHRCLKNGRMHEMDDKESVRVTHEHEKELEEMNRKKNMNIAQIIKETVERERERMEEDRNEEEKSDEDDDEWEEMEMVEGDEGSMTTVEVKIETMKKLKAPWKAKWIRQEVNREVRQRCENIHKAHLISYMSHLRHLMAEAKSLTRKDGGIPLAARALSIIPSHLLDTVKNTKKKKSTVDETTVRVNELIEWWKKEFKKVDKAKAKKWEVLNEENRLEEMMESRQFETTKDAAVLFLSFSSLLLIPIRLISRCLVVTKKPKENLPLSKKETSVKWKKEEVSEQKKEESIDYWCELWSEEEKTWRVFDPSVESVSTPKKKRKKMKKEDEEVDGGGKFESWMDKSGNVIYFIAVDENFSLCDVSPRYLNGKDAISRELRGRRGNEEWLKDLWKNTMWKVDSTIREREEQEWIEGMRKMEMPKNVAAFKDHPLYVLDKDVLKMQKIFPYDTKPIGEIRDYKIFLRQFLRPINTSKWYEKMGRQIKKGEFACGEKQMTNRMTGEKGTQGLYGYWQTERWNGGEVKEGRLPRNEFDNIYLYQSEMCPRGGIYLEPDGIQRVALELGKDFVPAVIAWYYKGGKTIPLIRGAIFIKEDVPELIAAWRKSYRRWKEEEKRIRSDRSLSNWKKLIKGIMRLSEMRKEFEPIENKKKKGKTLDDDEVKEEEKLT
ncbi:hypothetical protein PFISCL1PPCAC_14942, partial [Pristionchus fissidentatus]